jgi:hypothetical protein
MRRGLLVLSSLLAAAPACSDDSTQFWLPKNDLLPMVALHGDGASPNGSLAFVEKTTATAFLLDPADPSLRPRLVPVGKQPVAAARHTGSNRLLVWTAGDPGSSAKATIPPQLIIVDPAAAASAPPHTDNLANSFDGLAQSDDGRFAVLYHTPATKSATNGALFSPNEMVVADFSANVAGPPVLTPKSIRSLGNVPSSIRFSPTYSGRGEHRLAAVLSQNYLTIFDLLNVSQSEISLPLCLAGSSCNYDINDVVFDPSNFKLYVRAERAKDIFQVSLSEAEVPDANAKYDLVASLSMLAVGASATDMVLYGTGKDARLAVVAPSAKSLMIINPSTSNAVSVAMAIPANKIVPFTLPSLGLASKARSQALLLDLEKGSTSVLFADFGSAESATGTPPKQLAISGSASSVVPVSSYDPGASVAAPNVAVLIFGRASSGSVLSVVNLDTQSFFDFSAGSALTSSYLEVRAAAATGRLWSLISPNDGVSSANSGIYYRDLPTSVGTPPPTIWLDQTITTITPLFDKDGVRTLVLGHSDPTGYGNLTLLDARNPDRATARTAYGFLFTDYLGRNQP